jgi:hypothetical protein
MTPKRPRDANQLARHVIGIATGEIDEKAVSVDKAEKNSAAVELGRLGGKKGGPARAKSLSPNQLKDIAKKGAAARWKDKDPPD